MEIKCSNTRRTVFIIYLVTWFRNETRENEVLLFFFIFLFTCPIICSSQNRGIVNSHFDNLFKIQ